MQITRVKEIIMGSTRQHARFPSSTPALLPTVIGAALMTFAAGCERSSPPADTNAAPPVAAAPSAVDDVEVTELALAVVKPLPASWSAEGDTPARVALGKALYFDARLSKNHDISCNSCHDVKRFGVDGEATSPGHKGQRGDRNSPTVFNAAGQFAQFWDGRAANVEEQAIGPILNPVEMAMPNEEHVLKVIGSMPGYLEMFDKAFPGEKTPLTYKNVGVAIGAYERKLVTPSPVDAYLGGDKSALTAAQKRGWNTFASVGCTACHAGELLGGAMYQKAGLVKPWPDADDKGRAVVTNNEAEAFFFKVPTLRHVAKTGPYFHDGSVASLEEAVKMMGSYQLGKELSAEEVKDIVSFLEALTGEAPEGLIEPPELPASTDKTPPPNPA
jgi:cytochrome c peroxidase